MPEIPTQFEPRFLEHMDQRTVAARELRQRLNAITDDLGGADQLSYARRSLVRRAVWLESWLETQEAKAAQGEDVDIGRQTQALNALLGLYKTIGLERRAKEVPSLHDYLNQKARGAEDGAT